MDRFNELSDDTIQEFMDIFNRKSFPLPIKFQFIGDSKSKNVIKIAKLPDDISFVLDKELKVTINEDLLNAYDEESITILFEQEIDRINHNIDSGKIKLVKTDLNTFSSLVNKYGVEKVARANKVEELYQQQKADAEGDEFII
jgi:hypothetical protein